VLIFSDLEESHKVGFRYLDEIGYGFTAVFTVEAVLKMIAMGFMYHKNAYL
jgi:hypothetical protein